MKKTLFTLVGIAALVAAIAVVVFRPGREAGRRTGPATWYGAWLPPDTLATASLTDLNSLASSFPRTPLGRFLARDSMDRILAGLRVDPNKIRKYNEFHDAVARVMTNPAFQAIFGDDAALALLPPDGQEVRRDPDMALRRSLVAFATSSSSRTMERLARLIMGGRVSRESVGAVEMTRISLDDRTTVHAYIRGRALLLALDPRPIVTCLRTRDGRGKTLRRNASFVAALSLWKEARGHPLLDAFVSVPGLRRLLRESGGARGAEAARSLQGMEYFASSVRRGAGELRVVTRTGVHGKELPGPVRAGFASVTANTTQGLVTPQILSYYWCSSFDSFLLGRILSGENARGRQEADARLRRELGIPLARLRAAFGPQCGVILDRVVGSGLFPVPQGVLFVQVRDRAAAAEVVAALRRDLARRGMAGEDSETVQGYTISSWPLLPGEATRLALVLTDDMLYLANGRPPLRRLLARQPGPGLSPPMARLMGSEMSGRFGDANYGAMVLRPARLAAQGRPVADWLARAAAASDHPVSLQPLNRQLLALLGSLDIVVGASRVEGNSASSEILFRNMPQENGR